MNGKEQRVMGSVQVKPIYPHQAEHARAISLGVRALKRSGTQPHEIFAHVAKNMASVPARDGRKPIQIWSKNLSLIVGAGHSERESAGRGIRACANARAHVLGVQARSKHLDLVHQILNLGGVAVHVHNSTSPNCSHGGRCAKQAIGVSVRLTAEEVSRPCGPATAGQTA
jgi:hypothetical protein